MPLSDLELLCFEHPIEMAFVAMLKDNGIANCYESRSILEAETPWVEVALITGQPYGPGHAHANGQTGTSSGAVSDSAWESRLEFTVSSRRTTDHQSAEGLSHKRFIGIIRALCRAPVLRHLWPLQSSSSLYGLTGIKEAGSINSFDDEKNLDFTVISFTLRHNINPSAWAS